MITALTDVEKVLTNYIDELTEGLSIDERLEYLKSAKKTCNEIIDTAIKNQNKLVTYCPYCHEYFLTTSWNEIVNQEERDIQTSGFTDDFGHRDPSNWSKIRFKVIYKQCPKGHLSEDVKYEI